MPSRVIDRIDLDILRELQRNARLSNVELAERINLSPSPCLARVRSLERMGAINRYVALVDPRAVGLGLSVFVQVRLERQVEETLDRFEKAVARFPEVVECYLMSGDSDYLLRVVVADVKALKEFILNGLTRLQGVANIRSSFALKQVKYDTALPLPDRIDTNSEKPVGRRAADRPRRRNRRG